MRLPAPATRRRTIRALFCAVVVLLSTTTLTQADATTVTASAVASVQPGNFTGYAFDACTAPSSASMTAWLSSPYRGVGIYIGGNNRGCTQADLTAGWVDEQRRAGWHLIPLYVGPQASCTGVTGKRNLIDNTRAGSMGAAAAQDAAYQARLLGLAPQSVLIYDMEAYRTGDVACRNGVLAFMNAWTARLHDLGYLSGFYSSMGSGGADQVANYAAPGYVRPVYLDFARWDLTPTVADKAIPAGYWAPHRRMKQYQGAHTETWGGVTINIDNNYVDFAVLPPARLADFTRNGWSDVLARSGDSLYLYTGNGTTLNEGGRRKLGTGFAKMNAVVRLDLNRDGYEDVVARQSSTGYLWYYPGTSTGLNKKRKLATGFKGMREVTAVGDLNRDGYPDLVAAQTNNRNLYLYPGKKGGKLGARRLIWRGSWNTMSELAGVGDLNRDGYPDLVARQTTTGNLYLYAGRKGKLATKPKRIATGFKGMRDVFGVGDFNRDGYLDLAAVQKSTGYLMLYPGTAGVLRPGVRLATGYGGRSALL
ncbi:glycoside hydrolase domain-containing protein [Micromonosporaceae bacterium Da 78-11]